MKPHIYTTQPCKTLVSHTQVPTNYVQEGITGCYYKALTDIPLLHIFELLHSVLCVSLADLSKGLILVTSLLHIFQVKQIQPCLLGIITALSKVRGQRLQIN